MNSDAQAASAQPSAEMIQKLTLRGSSPTWTCFAPNSAGNTLPLPLQLHLKLSDWRKKLVLPDLRAFKNQTVAGRRCRGRSIQRRRLRRGDRAGGRRRAIRKRHVAAARQARGRLR